VTLVDYEEQKSLARYSCCKCLLFGYIRQKLFVDTKIYL